MACIAAVAMAPTEVEKVETEVIEPKEDLTTAEGHLYGYGHGLYGGSTRLTH